ncbi:hypothetical protein FGK63_16695 [Ruegeria sediminis]|uniref:Exonuclease domain-containing protein n=2 Tax=Ruegeria sediminis TaxID=2583820 RepID=A0ABY2WUH9_9RHOB|nr:hypothetical protein FGK63_16695 [Ruegeria sediminis]
MKVYTVRVANRKPFNIYRQGLVAPCPYSETPRKLVLCAIASRSWAEWRRCFRTMMQSSEPDHGFGYLVGADNGIMRVVTDLAFDCVDVGAMKLAFIDFEASSLRRGSFPIEVGLACIEGSEIRTASVLVRPAKHWNMSSWSLESQKLHGISRDLLESEGLDVQAVSNWLVAQIAGKVVVSDAPGHDQRWLDMLLKARGFEPNILLAGMDALLSRFTGPAYDAACETLAALPQPHRAGPDAERLARAYAAAMIEKQTMSDQK